MVFLFFFSGNNQGFNWVILRGSHRYIFNRKDESIHVFGSHRHILNRKDESIHVFKCRMCCSSNKTNALDITVTNIRHTQK